jgi:general stress protein 26
MENPQALEKLGELIRGIEFAMLTTADEHGELRSRPMSTQSTDRPFDGTLWFFTSVSSPKTSEIRRDQHVNLAYADPKGNRWVSVSGRCELVRDRAQAERLWTPAMKAWFPEGLDDPELALLKVSATQAEYWDAPSSKMVQLFGLVKAMATGERARPPAERAQLAEPSKDHAKLDQVG